jgi:hypothetical protein
VLENIKPIFGLIPCFEHTKVKTWGFQSINIVGEDFRKIRVVAGKPNVVSAGKKLI